MHSKQKGGRSLYLTDEQLSYFHSDFKIVADYFVQMQRTGDYVPSHERIQYVEAVLQLLSVLTEDNRFEETVNQPEGSAKGGVNNMCEVLDRVEARGIAIGEPRGEIKGTIKIYFDETDLRLVEITKKIMDRFSLDKDSIEKYVEEILGIQLHSKQKVGRREVQNMCDVFDRIEEKGIAIGEARGEIKGTIKFYRDEMDLKPVEITKRIMDRFSLDKDSAEKYVEEILGTQLA